MEQQIPDRRGGKQWDLKCSGDDHDTLTMLDQREHLLNEGRINETISHHHRRGALPAPGSVQRPGSLPQRGGSTRLARRGRHSAGARLHDPGARPLVGPIREPQSRRGIPFAGHEKDDANSSPWEWAPGQPATVSRNRSPTVSHWFSNDRYGIRHPVWNAVSDRTVHALYGYGANGGRSNGSQVSWNVIE
jgi:hypothetical protein